jgi:hypothetical protein
MYLEETKYFQQYDECKARGLQSAVFGAYWNKRRGATRR